MKASVDPPFILRSQDRPVCILIGDDDLRMAGLILRGLGLAADVAPNGEEALISAGAHEHDAIVLGRNGSWHRRVRDLSAVATSRCVDAGPHVDRAIPLRIQEEGLADLRAMH